MEPVDDFYEDDEPVEKIIDIFDRGDKGVTAPKSAVRSVRVTWSSHPRVANDIDVLWHSENSGAAVPSGRPARPREAQVLV